jgi:hypothetical protein
MKKHIFVAAIFTPIFCHAASFGDFTTTLEKVGGYSQNANYDSQHCMVHFTKDAPSGCGSKSRGVIYLEKNIGSLMCSVALTAFVSGKDVTISSHDECDAIHNAPIIRYIEVKN